MVRTEVKISMKKKYSACLYFKLLKSYPSASGFFIAGNPFVKKPRVPVLALPSNMM
jgi:hypothetical protein